MARQGTRMLYRSATSLPLSDRGDLGFVVPIRFGGGSLKGWGVLPGKGDEEEGERGRV